MVIPYSWFVYFTYGSSTLSIASIVIYSSPSLVQPPIQQIPFKFYHYYRGLIRRKLRVLITFVRWGNFAYDGFNYGSWTLQGLIRF